MRAEAVVGISMLGATDVIAFCIGCCSTPVSTTKPPLYDADSDAADVCNVDDNRNMQAHNEVPTNAHRRTSAEIPVTVTRAVTAAPVQ
jgi:hypothetical protein